MDKLAINLIKQNPYQPRKYFSKENIESLSSNIKSNGLLSPVIINYLNNKYYLIAGERRFRACKLLNWKQIPVIIKQMPVERMRILALVENIEREDLNLIEIAYSLKKIAEENNWTHDQIAKQVSKSRTYVTNAIRLLNLPVEVQQMIINKELSHSHARSLLSIKDSKDIVNTANDLITNKVNVRDTEKIISKKTTLTKIKTTKTTSAHLNKIKFDIEDQLNRKIKITDKNLSFPYKSPSDLKTLLDKLYLTKEEENE